MTEKNIPSDLFVPYKVDDSESEKLQHQNILIGEVYLKDFSHQKQLLSCS